MKVHITKITATDKAKDGRPLIGKSGKPFYKVGIKTNEHGDTWINGLMPFNPDKWEGTEQELEIYDEEYQGKTYKKFKLPARSNGGMSQGDRDMLQKIFQEVFAARQEIVMVRQLLQEKGVLPKAKVVDTTLEYPEDELGESSF